MNASDKPLPPWRQQLHEIIFEADTPAGKAFDIVLLVLIVLSIVAVMLESVAPIEAVYGPQLRAAEWVFTILFSVEYLLRIVSIGRPRSYMLSFFGIVDLLSVLPSYISVLVPGAQSLLLIRVLRLLRAFRVLKLAHFVHDADELSAALQASRRKILVFVATVLTVVVVVGAVMYLLEGEESGFTSIPKSVYWAIVTLTTVGYGDITPLTVPGRLLAACLMVTGYGIIAVPTGIVTAELTMKRFGRISTQSCEQCSREGHDPDARCCKYCGAILNPSAPPTAT